ncbi:hypothetical protein I315_06003 [Cryptococcus gattii Ru294]|nr:hypothetical protein I315_06003 [Cryptococcus gattii Ru294]
MSGDSDMLPRARCLTISLPQSLLYITVLFSLLSRPLDIMQPSHILKLAQYLQVIYGSSGTS